MGLNQFLMQTHTHILLLLLMKSLFTWTHTYPTDGYIPLQWQEFHVYSWYLYLPTTYTYLYPIHWCVCFHADYCTNTTTMYCIIFSHCSPAFLCCSHCFLLLHSYMTSTKHTCVTSVIAVHSYKVLPFLRHLTYLSMLQCACRWMT